MITESQAEAVTALSKAAEAIAPILDKPVALVVDALRFTGQLLGAPLAVATEMLKDYVYARQTWARLRIIEKTQRLVAGKDIPAQCVPPGFLVPFFDGSGNAQDEPIQDLWAALLASALTTEAARNPAFVHVLKAMSPSDAQAFERVMRGANEPQRFFPERSVFMFGPETISIEWAHLNALGVIHIFTTPGATGYGRELPDWSPPRVDWKMAVTAFGFEFAIALGLASRRTGPCTA